MQYQEILDQNQAYINQKKSLCIIGIVTCASTTVIALLDLIYFMNSDPKDKIIGTAVNAPLLGASIVASVFLFRKKHELSNLPSTTFNSGGAAP